MRRRILLASLGLLLALLLIELGLQALSLVLWFGREEPAPSDSVGRRVICVGDSFTWGMGSEDPARDSYPAVLERAIAAAGIADLQVIKVARPSRNSREIAEALARELRRGPAERVYILAGMNDVWTRPEVIDSAALEDLSAESFPLRLRTLRMIKLLMRWASEPDSGLQPDAPYLGNWYDESTRLAITPIGRLLYQEKSYPWEARGPLLVTEVAGEEIEIRWRMDGERLILESSLWPERLVLQRGTTGVDDKFSRMGESLGMLDQVRSVLSAHLQLMAELVQASGGEAVLLSYPWSATGVGNVPRETATRIGVGFVAIEAQFRALQPAGDFRVPDNHCNTRGYAEMGRMVAEDAVAALRRKN